MKIFFAWIPWCLDPSLWSRVWRESNETRSHVLHSHISELLLTLDAVHSFLGQFRTENRSEADWVYFPTYFPLIFWYESEESLACVKNYFREYDFGDRAGYDHLINYGHEYPHWKKQSLALPPANRLLELDGYHAFLRNAFVLTVGHTHQGRRNQAVLGNMVDNVVPTTQPVEPRNISGTASTVAIPSSSSASSNGVGVPARPTEGRDEKEDHNGSVLAQTATSADGAVSAGGLFALQRFIIHPYFVSFDCDKAYRTLADFSSRPVHVLFVGAVKVREDTNFIFRERLLMMEAVNMDWKDEERVYFQPVLGDDSSRQALRLKQDEFLLLYGAARFCLVMPGDGNTAQRLFHVMTQGCIPVFVYHKDSYVVLPFEGYLDYADFSLFFQVATLEEGREVLHKLLEGDVAQEAASTRKFAEMQRRVLQAAPYISMELAENCARFGLNAMESSALYLLHRELEDRLYWRDKFLIPKIGFRARHKKQQTTSSSTIDRDRPPTSTIDTAGPPSLAPSVVLNATFFLHWGALWHTVDVDLNRTENGNIALGPKSNVSNDQDTGPTYRSMHWQNRSRVLVSAMLNVFHEIL
ncbi:unnamed protein product [Amoebophrya sp. A25]|nr:unnamed protein product [Amoebophrya sp. A25]|eukprot:GSA25T00001868001.1